MGDNSIFRIIDDAQGLDTVLVIIKIFLEVFYIRFCCFLREAGIDNLIRIFFCMSDITLLHLKQFLPGGNISNQIRDQSHSLRIIVRRINILIFNKETVFRSSLDLSCYCSGCKSIYAYEIFKVPAKQRIILISCINRRAIIP